MADESMAEKCEKMGIQVTRGVQGEDEGTPAASEGPRLRFVKDFTELL
jgi:hypothetical protein